MRLTPLYLPRRCYGSLGGGEQGRLFEIALGEPPPGCTPQLFGERRRPRRRDTNHRVVAVGRDHDVAVVKDALGILAGLDRPDAAADLVAEHRDAPIGGTEMFQTMDGDRALRDLGFEIARMPLAFLVGIPAEP